MKKKVVLLTSSVAAVGLAIGALTFSGSLGALDLSANGNPYTGNHTIEFTAADTVAGQYDDYAQSFSVYKENAFKDGDGTQYGLGSVEFNDSDWPYEGSFFYGAQAEHMTFGGSYILSIIPADSYSELTVQFSLIKRANLDLNGSFIEFYRTKGQQNPEEPSDVNVYDNSSKFSVFDDSDEEYTTYSATAGFQSYYGYEIHVTKIKLVFTCYSN